MSPTLCSTLSGSGTVIPFSTAPMLSFTGAPATDAPEDVAASAVELVTFFTLIVFYLLLFLVGVGCALLETRYRWFIGGGNAPGRGVPCTVAGGIVSSQTLRTLCHFFAGLFHHAFGMCTLVFLEVSRCVHPYKKRGSPAKFWLGWLGRVASRQLRFHHGRHRLRNHD